MVQESLLPTCDAETRHTGNHLEVLRKVVRDFLQRKVSPALLLWCLILLIESLMSIRAASTGS